MEVPWCRRPVLASLIALWLLDRHRKQVPERLLVPEVEKTEVSPAQAREAMEDSETDEDVCSERWQMGKEQRVEEKEGVARTVEMIFAPSCY